MEKSNFAIWLAVNEDGDAAVSMEGSAEARQALVEDYAGASIRTVEIRVTMALPEITKTSIDVPADAGEIDAAAA
jgi:hypothetical protein